MAEARDQLNRALRQFSEWAADNSVAPEPSKTQLLVPASSAALRGGATAAGCEMSGAGIPPQEVIKILGVLLEGSLCWEAQAAAACVRSRNASFAVLRAARHLCVKDRSRLVASLALPHLDMCRLAMPSPSTAAEDTWRRAYHRAVRTAAGTQLSRHARVRLRFPAWASSDTALVRCRWPTWNRRCAAIRAAGVSKVWHSENPRRIRSLLAGSPSDQCT